MQHSLVIILIGREDAVSIFYTELFTKPGPESDWFLHNSAIAANEKQSLQIAVQSDNTILKQFRLFAAHAATAANQDRVVWACDDNLLKYP